MKSLHHAGTVPAGQTLPADDILELHAGRILLLMRYCGQAGRIDGLTKLAKLDFFVRYPEAFNRMAAHLGKLKSPVKGAVESPMVRHHYGPWDKRYYQVLPFLEGRRLIQVSQHGDTFTFELTKSGKVVAELLAEDPAFEPLLETMRRVKPVLGNKTGNTLKRLIYQVFTEEVAHRPLGKMIA